MRNFASRRRGTSVAELFVASALLISGMAVVGPLSFASSRLATETRHCQLAIDELANHARRLSTVPEDELDVEIEQIEPTAAIRTAIPNVELDAKRIEDQDGRRVQISIRWAKRSGHVSLTVDAWQAPDVEKVGATSDKRRGDR